jgi:hypothetical protein
MGVFLGCVCEGGSPELCARGMQARMFVALSRERARLAGAKNDAGAGLWRNAARWRFWRARLCTALVGSRGAMKSPLLFLSHARPPHAVEVVLARPAAARWVSAAPSGLEQARPPRRRSGAPGSRTP